MGGVADPPPPTPFGSLRSPLSPHLAYDADRAFAYGHVCSGVDGRAVPAAPPCGFAARDGYAVGGL